MTVAWPDWLSPASNAIHTAIENEMKDALEHCFESADAAGVPWTMEGLLAVAASNVMSMLRRCGGPPPNVGDVKARPLPTWDCDDEDDESEEPEESPGPRVTAVQVREALDEALNGARARIAGLRTPEEDLDAATAAVMGIIDGPPPAEPPWLSALREAERLADETIAAIQERRGRCLACGDEWPELDAITVCPECHSTNVTEVTPGEKDADADR